MLADDQNTRERRSAHRTQWAAQFAVASELCKRNYKVAFTMGNHPLIDLMVISPNGKSFNIDVKGLYKKNYWVVRQRSQSAGLFYVFAFVPNDAPNQFFILTQDQVNEGLRANLEYAKATKKAKGLPFDEAHNFPCISWDFARRYEDRWRSLPK